MLLATLPVQTLVQTDCEKNVAPFILDGDDVVKGPLRGGLP